MPLYTFKNTKTNEEYDEVMSYEELQEYLKQELRKKALVPYKKPNTSIIPFINRI